MERQISINELIARKMIDKFKVEVGRLSAELAEALVKNELLTESLKKKEEEVIELNIKAEVSE